MQRRGVTRLLLWLTTLLSPASAADCFAGSDAILLPQLMNYKLWGSGYTEKYHAIDGTDSFIIYGGETTQALLSAANSSNERPLIVRMDLDLYTRRWAKVLQSANLYYVVEAVAIKKNSEDQVAIWVRKISGGGFETGLARGALIVLYTANGGMVNEIALEVRHNSDGYKYETFSSAMYFSSHGSIAMAWKFNPALNRPTVGGVEYDGTMRVALFSATDTTGPTWYHEFDPSYFGRSSSLAFVEAGDAASSHIYIGGAVDNNARSGTDPIDTVQWSPSLFHVNGDGSEVNSELLRLKQDGAFQDCNFPWSDSCHDKLAIIDHLSYSSAQQKLYGTTRSFDQSNFGSQVYAFMIESPGGTSITTNSLVSRRLDFSNSHYVTGIDQEMASASTFNAVFFDSANSKLYHVVIDVAGASSLTATLLYDDISYIRETFFTPTRSTETINGASVQLSFSVGYDADLNYLNGGSLAAKTSPSGGEMGIVLPSHRQRSCLTVTDETITIGDLSEELTLDNGSKNAGSFSNSLSTVLTLTARNIDSYDIVVGELELNTWCQPFVGPYTISNPVVADFCTVVFDGQTQSASLTLPVLDSTVCDNYNEAGLWSVELETADSFDQALIKVTVDPNGTVFVTGINAQTHPDIAFTANFALPNLQIVSDTFTVSEAACSCSPLTVTAATGLSGTGFTMGDITPFNVLTFAASDFTITPSGCTVTYGYSITPVLDTPSAIDTSSVFAFDSASRTFTVTSTTVNQYSKAHAAYTDTGTGVISMSPVQYDFEVWVIDDTGTAVNTAATEKLTFSTTLTDPCYLATLDLSSGVVTDGTYLIESTNTQQDQVFVVSNLVSSTTYTGCPAYLYEVTMSDGSAISAPFSFDASTGTFTVQTDDGADVGTYDFLLKAQYYNSQSNYNTGGTEAFQYVLCDIVSLTASSLSDAEYTIGESAVTATFSAFALGVACSSATVAYTFSTSPDCSTIVNLDLATRTFTFVGDETISSVFALAGTSSITYTVTVTGTSGATTASTTFDLVVKNPCVDSALSTITVPADSIETYTINSGLQTAALPTGFASSLSVCGAIDFTVMGTEAGVVDYSSGSSQLEIQTADVNRSGTSVPITIQPFLANYSTIVGSSVTVDVQFVCDIVSLTPGSLADQEYTIGESAVTMASFSDFTPQVACPGTTVTYSSASSPDCSAIMNLDQVTRTFTFEGDETISSVFALAGTSSITYTVTVTGTSGATTASTTFDLVVKNPCVDSTLSSITVPADSIETYTINSGLQTAALPTGFASSLSVCGAIDYTVTGTEAGVVDYSSGSSQLEIQTADVNRSGTSVPITIQPFLANYSTIVGSSVIVDVQFSCDIVSLTASSLSDAEYTISESAVTATFSDFTPGVACPGATVTYTFSTSPDCSAIVNLDSATRTFTFEGNEAISSVFALAGTSSITYTVTVTGTSGTSTASTTFDLVVKNPCIDSALSTITVPDGTLEAYTIGDGLKTVALPTSFVPSPTACGEVAFVVTSPITAIVFDEESASLLIETADTSLGGTIAEVTVQAYLKDYPSFVVSADPVLIIVEMTVVAVDVSQYFIPEDLPPEFTSEQYTSIEYDPFTASENTISIGTLADFEGDDFEVEFTEQEPFMTPMSNEDGELTVTLGATAEPGNYTLAYSVIQTIDDEVKVQNYTLDIHVTNSSFVPFAGVDISKFESEDLEELVESPTSPDKDPPTMEIENISLYGTVEVIFSEPFLIPSNATINVNKEVINVTVIPTNPAMAPVLGFDWELVSFSTTKMVLQLTWELPIFVSKETAGYDELQIEVLDENFFLAKASAKTVVEPTIITQDLPQQVALDQKEVMEARQAQADSIQFSSGTLVGANLAANIALSGSLAVLWGLVNSLQIISHFKLLRVIMPTENVKIYYDVLYELATFDIVPTDQIVAYLQESAGLGKDESLGEDQLSPQATEAGYESSDVFENSFETFLLFFFVFCILLLIGLACLCFRKYQRVRNIVQKIWRKLFWNTFIRSILETAIEIIIAGMIKTQTFSTEDVYQTFTSIYTSLTIIIIVAFAILIPIFLHKSQRNLRRKRWTDKYGSLTLNMNTRREEFSPKLYQSFFLARRLVLGALIVYAGNHTYFQFGVMTFITSLHVIYIGMSQPFALPWLNSLELFNEYMVLTNATFLFAYSDGLLNMPNPGFPEHDEAISDEESKLELGWYNVGLLCFFIAVNLAVMVVNQIKMIHQKIRRFFAKRRHAKMMKEHERRKKAKIALDALVYSDDDEVPAAAAAGTSVVAVTKNSARKRQQNQRKTSPLNQSSLLEIQEELDEDSARSTPAQAQAQADQTMKQGQSGVVSQLLNQSAFAESVPQQNKSAAADKVQDSANSMTVDVKDRVIEPFVWQAPPRKDTDPFSVSHYLSNPRSNKINLNDNKQQSSGGIDIDNLYSPMDATPVVVGTPTKTGKANPTPKKPGILGIGNIGKPFGGGGIPPSPKQPTPAEVKKDFMKKVELPSWFLNKPSLLDGLNTMNGAVAKQGGSQRDFGGNNRNQAANGLSASDQSQPGLTKNPPKSSRIQFFNKSGEVIAQGSNTFDGKGQQKQGSGSDLFDQLETLSKQNGKGQSSSDYLSAPKPQLFEVPPSTDISKEQSSSYMQIKPKFNGLQLSMLNEVQKPQSKSDLAKKQMRQQVEKLKQEELEQRRKLSKRH